MINLTMAKFNAKNPQTGEFEPLDGASLARVQSDWNENDNTAEDFIKNKPNLGAAASKNVDQVPTLSSPNLVESNGVAAALSTKADTSSLGTAAAKGVDASPTASSTNLVESGGVEAALTDKADLSILTPMTQAQYDALVTKTAPLYFIYEDGEGA